MQDLAQKFKRQAAAKRNGAAYFRYPDELRAMALEHIADVQRRGLTLESAARDLGIDTNTLRSWRRAAAAAAASKKPRSRAKANGFRNVEIAKTTGSARYVVLGPSELRIECAEAEDVAALIRALA